MRLMRRKLAWILLSPWLGAACNSSQGEKATLPPKTETAPAQPEAKAPAAAKVDGQPITSAPPGGEGQGAEPSGTNLTTLDKGIDYRLTGEVTSQRKSALAFRVGGFIQTIHVKPGAALKKGEALATLDDRDFVIRAELARAKVQLARVAADDAEKEFRREQELKRENASTGASFDKVKAAFDQAKLQQRLAELDLQSAELALKDTKLVAPYDCVVATQLHYDGESIAAGGGPAVATVFEVYDTSEPEITLTAPERMLGQIHVGTKLTIAVPSVGFSGKGEVVRMVPVVADKTRTFQVTARLSERSSKIVPGNYAEATVD